ncbi:hypothetical protein RRG08_027042 [Elysia crispata]|uniref:Uncharacterized protein n=1 Tax=Elysia crispata TaxID=231223 RepID=A0AAE1DGB5_9GAST|nr:hypothetical protein RRG08_027042 [Elysia crispata]
MPLAGVPCVAFHHPPSDTGQYLSNVSLSEDLPCTPGGLKQRACHFEEVPQSDLILYLDFDFVKRSSQLKISEDAMVSS